MNLEKRVALATLSDRIFGLDSFFDVPNGFSRSVLTRHLYVLQARISGVLYARK